MCFNTRVYARARASVSVNTDAIHAMVIMEDLSTLHVRV
jgi:hypothetical protein